MTKTLRVMSNISDFIAIAVLADIGVDVKVESGSFAEAEFEIGGFEAEIFVSIGRAYQDDLIVSCQSCKLHSYPETYQH